MPVTGLPAAVERTLGALLTDNAVSSWKVAGEGDSVVFVLRLKPVDTAVSTNMADPTVNRSTQAQYYRKKSFSQRRRDVERSRKHKEKQASVVCESDCVLSASSLPDSGVEQGNTACVDTHGIDLPTTHTQDINTKTSVKLPSSVDLEPPCMSDCSDCADMCVLQPEVNHDNIVGAFDTGNVKQYVATLTDSSVQKRLRDRQRYTHFRKSVLHHSDGEDIVTCESDDIVIQYACQPDTEPVCVYWFVKQQEKNMLKEERVKLASLRNGKRIQNTLHRETLSSASRDLAILRELLQ